MTDTNIAPALRAFVAELQDQVNLMSTHACKLRQALETSMDELKATREALHKERQRADSLQAKLNPETEPIPADIDHMATPNGAAQSGD